MAHSFVISPPLVVGHDDYVECLFSPRAFLWRGEMPKPQDVLKGRKTSVVRWPSLSVPWIQRFSALTKTSFDVQLDERRPGKSPPWCIT